LRNGTCVVGTINDQIVPWHGSCRTGGLMGGHVRYVLSSGGHIAGIVNPPGPKAWYEAADYAGPDPEAWRASATRHRGSVAGLDDVVRLPRRRTRKAASHGQRAAPGHRGCYGRVRARLIQVRQADSIGGTPWVT
jgi:poly(3-hydroxyalkanoate) synthetase